VVEDESSRVGCVHYEFLGGTLPLHLGSEGFDELAFVFTACQCQATTAARQWRGTSNLRPVCTVLSPPPPLPPSPPPPIPPLATVRSKPSNLRPLCTVHTGFARIVLAKMLVRSHDCLLLGVIQMICLSGVSFGTLPSWNSVKTM
jgi:hypothetical protein